MRSADPAMAVTIDRWFGCLAKIRSLIHRKELGSKELVLLDCVLEALAHRKPCDDIFHPDLRVIDCSRVIDTQNVPGLCMWRAGSQVGEGQLVWNPHKVQLHRCDALVGAEAQGGDILGGDVFAAAQSKYWDESARIFKKLVPLNANVALAIRGDQSMALAEWSGTLVFLGTLFGDWDGSAVYCLEKEGSEWTGKVLPFDKRWPADYQVVLWPASDLVPEWEIPSVLESGRLVEGRCLPKKPEDIRPHPRVWILGEDGSHFTKFIAYLLPGEGVCWRCGTPHPDPNGSLDTCPTCGRDFND